MSPERLRRRRGAAFLTKGKNLDFT